MPTSAQGKPQDSIRSDKQVRKEFEAAISKALKMNDAARAELFELAATLHEVPMDDQPGKAAARAAYLKRAKQFNVDPVTGGKPHSPENAVLALEAITGPTPGRPKREFY